MVELKQWLREHCFSSNGSLNNRCTFKSWWVNKGFIEQYEQIRSLYPFEDITKIIYHILNELDQEPVCEMCGNKVAFLNFKSGYRRLCSVQCTFKDPIRLEKIKATSGDYSKMVESCRTTSLNRYGVTSPFCLEEVKDKIKQTKQQKYGDENFCNRDKARATTKIKYGKEYLFQTDEFKEHNYLKLKERFSEPNFHIKLGFESNGEKEVREFLNSFGHSFKKTRGLIYPLEIDMYDETLRLAVEYNGLYWHSEKYVNNSYHFKKYRMLKDKGIKLITIFEDEWLFSKEKVKSFLLASIGNFEQRLYARNCVVHSLDKRMAKQFIETFHLQGAPNQIQDAYGIFHKDDLLGVVSYGKHHRNNTDIVLNRLVFKNGIQVVGGASKLILNSIKKYDTVTTWSDNRWSTGEIYRTIGFEKVLDIPPDYFYTKNNQYKITKQSQQKSRTGCPPELTEHSFALQNGLFRVYDCGKIKWKYTRKGE